MHVNNIDLIYTQNIKVKTTSQNNVPRTTRKSELNLNNFPNKNIYYTKLKNMNYVNECTNKN